MPDAVIRARALVGCRFRPQGRDPEIGLDCVGLACAVYRIPATDVPRDYRLRGAEQMRLRREIDRHFNPAHDPAAGDLLVCSVAADQLHLAILTDRGLVHADARLRMVVETPGAAPWPVLSVHRRRAQSNA